MKWWYINEIIGFFFFFFFFIDFLWQLFANQIWSLNAILFNQKPRLKTITKPIDINPKWNITSWTNIDFMPIENHSLFYIQCVYICWNFSIPLSCQYIQYRSGLILHSLNSFYWFVTNLLCAFYCTSDLDSSLYLLLTLSYSIDSFGSFVLE